MKFNRNIFHLFLLVIVLLFNRCSFHPFSPLVHKNAYPKEPYDVVIIPGFPYHVNSPHLILKARILWAKYLYDIGSTKKIIFSGGAVSTPYIEGEIMKAIADSLCIPAENTFAETHSEHSKENVFYSVKMAREKGFKNIAIATDVVQCLMLYKFIKTYYADIKLIPINFEEIDVHKKNFHCIDHECTIRKDFTPIQVRKNKEERRKGTRGENIQHLIKNSN